MDDARRGIVLVGHGGIPADCPRELVTNLKRLEAQRRERGGAPTAEEGELDRRIRHWPRTPETDPYQAGLEALAAHVRPLLTESLFAVAYNEFCAPTLEEAVRALITAGARDITVVSSMLTPGGAHSEVEIPQTLQQLRDQHPEVVVRYAWPFDLHAVAALLVRHLRDFSRDRPGPGGRTISGALES